MLYHEYGNPLMLLDQMIQVQRFDDFIVEFMQQIDERKAWEFYLHRVGENISFDDYLKKIRQPEPEPIDMNKVETTVKNSMKILENFKL